MDRNSQRASRRGNTAVTLGVSLSVLLGFGAFGLEFGYRGLQERHWQAVVDHSSHAAVQFLDGTSAGMAKARLAGGDFASYHTAGGTAASINTAPGSTEFEFGCVDASAASPTFVKYGTGTCVADASGQPVLVNAVRATKTTNTWNVLSGALFGSGLKAHVTSTIMQGLNGSDCPDGSCDHGLSAGHIDFDTVLPMKDCIGTGATRCNSFYSHAHQYDDNAVNVTSTRVLIDLFAPEDVYTSQQVGASNAGGTFRQLGLNDCIKINAAGKYAVMSEGDAGAGTTHISTACTGAGETRPFPMSQAFKILVLNADLSPGLTINVNGAGNVPVKVYDNASFASLPAFSLDGTAPGTTRLESLTISIDTAAIANCNLHPIGFDCATTNANGFYGEIRNGALTVQLVATTATQTPNTSDGDQQAVLNYGSGAYGSNNGLLWESYFFWHWDTNNTSYSDLCYTSSNVYSNIYGAWHSPADRSNPDMSWTQAYAKLVCYEPVFID